MLNYLFIIMLDNFKYVKQLYYSPNALQIDRWINNVTMTWSRNWKDITLDAFKLEGAHFCELLRCFSFIWDMISSIWFQYIGTLYTLYILLLFEIYGNMYARNPPTFKPPLNVMILQNVTGTNYVLLTWFGWYIVRILCDGIVSHDLAFRQWCNVWIVGCGGSVWIGCGCWVQWVVSGRFGSITYRNETTWVIGVSGLNASSWQVRIMRTSRKSQENPALESLSNKDEKWSI